MWKIISAIVVLGVGLSLAALPSFISICHRSDPNLSDCVINSIEQLRPRLKVGIPILDIPPLDLLKVDDIVISRGTGQRTFMLNLTNIEAFGAGDFQVKKLKVDVPNMIYKQVVSIPSIRLRGDYAVDARILSFPIKSAGQFDANATHCEGDTILRAKLVHDKFDHLNFTDLTINLTIDDYYLKLNNIVKGNDELNQVINDFVNKNKNELINITIPFIEKATSAELLRISNRMVSNFEYDEVFPE